MGVAPQKLAEEDPTFRITPTRNRPDPDPGMGELHLEIIVDRMLREFKVRPMGRPQVAYKETIRKKVKAEGKFIRHSGGRGQYGHVVLEVEPRSGAAIFHQ